VAFEAIKLARSAALLDHLGELVEAAAREKETPGLIFLLVVSQAAQGQTRSAIRRAMETDFPAEGFLRLGETFESEGEQEAAAAAYAAFARHSGISPELRANIGVRAAEMALGLGDLEEARQVLQAILSTQAVPDVVVDQAAFLLADLDLTVGRDLPNAETIFARIAGQSANPDLQWRARWRLADVAFAKGDLDQAEQRYLALARETLAPNQTPPPPPFGIDILQTRGPRTIVLPVESYSAQDPRTTPAYAALQVAECAFRRGDFERAKDLFAEVAQAYPDSVFANDALERQLFLATHFANVRPEVEAYLAALTLAHTEKWPEALDKLRLIAEAGLSEPLADDAAMLCASILGWHGSREAAASEYRSIPERFPGTLLAADALLNAARLARCLGDEAQAREDLNRVLRNYVESPMAKTAALWLDDLDRGRPWVSP